MPVNSVLIASPRAAKKRNQLDAGGKVIWSYDAKQDFETVNGVVANGGSFGPAGAVIANGMVYVASGYVGIQQGSQGNVVLAFSVE